MYIYFEAVLCLVGKSSIDLCSDNHVNSKILISHWMNTLLEKSQRMENTKSLLLTLVDQKYTFVTQF